MKRLLTALVAVFLCLPAYAAVLYVPHFVQFFDDDGDPCNGCKLYTYTAGTTTPKATYTTETGGVSNANPVVMDASGRAVIFLTGSYKFRLEDANGNLIRETDNVTAFSTQTAGVDSITTNFTEAVVASGDSIIFADASDSNTTKRDTVDGVVDVVASTLAGKTDTVIAYSDKITFYDNSDSNLPKTDTTQGLRDLLLASLAVQVSTSGTAVNFPSASESIPAGTKAIHILFNGVSTNGTNRYILTIGDSGGLETTGYSSTISTGGSTNASTAGFQLTNETVAADAHSGWITLRLMDAATNTWVYGSQLNNPSTGPYVFSGAGSKTLSDVLTQFSITTIGGTNTFDAGKISVQYE